MSANETTAAESDDQRYIRILRQRITDLCTRESQLIEQRDHLQAQVDAVHAKHCPTSYDPTQCYCGNAYPCPTIQAINDATS